MYVNLKKTIAFLGVVLGVVILGFGIFSYFIGISSQQQTVGALTAVFGLQLTWFVLWLTR